MINSEQLTRLLEHVVELLDVSPTHYELATSRNRSLGDWMIRPASKLRPFQPETYVQGSFRYGTVIRPLFAGEEYDLDQVCQLEISKGRMSQAAVKGLVGDEVKAYAAAHGIHEPVTEKKRCWRLEYADDISFHIDVLPAVPEEEVIKHQLVERGVPTARAALAVAITDTDSDGFERIQGDWPPGNPAGFADWFEERMRPVAQARIAKLVEAQRYTSVEDVPVYEWRTPLQRSIQILKRHRDVRFREARHLRPISMILTTLAAEAYDGEVDLFKTLSGVLERMPGLVRSGDVRVPNPVNPDEDFADKWKDDPRLEKSFWEWHTSAQADIERLGTLWGASEIKRLIRRNFSVEADDDVLLAVAGDRSPAKVSILSSAPIVIKDPPRPWGSDAQC